MSRISGGAIGGTALVITYLSLVPGFLPTLVLVTVVTVVVLLPLLVIGLAVAAVALPPYGMWRLATGSRKRRRQEARSTVRASALPSTR